MVLTVCVFKQCFSSIVLGSIFVLLLFCSHGPIFGQCFGVYCIFCTVFGFYEHFCVGFLYPPICLLVGFYHFSLIITTIIFTRQVWVLGVQTSGFI